MNYRYIWRTKNRGIWDDYSVTYPSEDTAKTWYWLHGIWLEEKLGRKLSLFKERSDYKRKSEV